MSNLSFKQKIVGFLLALVAILGGGYSATQFGSAVTGQDYNATSTRGFNGGAMPNLTQISGKAGSLNRVTIGGTNNAVIRLWDATTTDVNKRTGNIASSSLAFVEFGTNATGTLEYDLDLKFGLTYELISGTAPTSTILTR